jgi:hypothetical protein
MNSYNKQSLDAIAKEQGFIRDNLEKVMRLVDILNYFHKSKLLSRTLVLKGGTAINLTVFELPRLSVDIDLDFSENCSREEMFVIRQKVNDEVLRYMQSEGYRLAPSSKSPLSLDSWVFHYTNAAGNNDSIKIEINYSDRCHIFPAVDVISVGLFGHSGDDEVWTEGTKEMLDDMHKRKIDMADEIFVINVGGYIGSSTRSEIEYALRHGKKVNSLCPIDLKEYYIGCNIL